MWPSYVQKLYLHYDDELLQRQERLRAEAAEAAALRRSERGEMMDSDEEEEGGLMLFGEWQGWSFWEGGRGAFNPAAESAQTAAAAPDPNQACGRA
jgi:hypothetical protein